MKIVVLDPIYLNNELNRKLERLGDVDIYNNFPSNRDEVVSRINNAEIVITASTNITGDIIEKSVNLKMLALACTGCNRIDLEVAKKNNIVVRNVSSYATDAVAEHVFAMLLAFLKNISKCDMAVRKLDFDWTKYKSASLANMNFGIIGFGNIGRRVSEIAEAFRCDIIIHDKSPDADTDRKFVNLAELLKISDIISLHLPLTKLTENIIGMNEFLLMQKNPILINTARGKIINHNALVEALERKLIRGACLDVFYNEPLNVNDPLLNFPNVILTPHNAFYTELAVHKCTEETLNNIEDFLKGNFTGSKEARK